MHGGRGWSSVYSSARKRKEPPGARRRRRRRIYRSLRPATVFAKIYKDTSHA